MSIIERARELRKQIEEGAAAMDDEKALNFIELFPAWNGNSIEYATGIRVRYDGVLYKVLQDHTSQADWTPTASPSLFAEVLIVDPSVVSAWVQPDSTNPYMAGDKVSHNDKTWVSDIDNNVWEPGVYGWSEVVE